MAQLWKVRPETQSMADRDLDTDILIVGAGPVGLFLANECARRGIRHRLIEARESQSQHSKALAVMPRTMEIFDMAGITAPFLEVAELVTSIAIVDPSRTFARMRFAPDESPYPFVAMIPQDATERLLVEQLRRKSGDVEYRTSFVSAVQYDDHVSTTIECDGSRRDLKAAFVVGCDGAHSTVRHMLNLQFLGATYDASFMLADIETNDALPADQLQLCPNAAGPLAIFPMSATRRRLVATVDKAEASQPSLETIRRVLAERGPSEMEARSVHWSSYFRVHHRQVANLRVGRVFLAADAAHIHSPIGGQGMNTGLGDAWNLVWKLDLALRGRASPLLIDSYNAERTPVIRSVIKMTDLMTKGLGTPSKLAQAARDLAIPLLFRFPPFRHMMVQRLSQLGISYSGSPIVKGGGERWFNDTLRGGGVCSKFLITLGNGTDQATKDAVEDLAAEMKDVVEVRPAAANGIKLVRPDGYLAFQTSNPTDATGTIQSLLRQMTGPARGH
jgi:2-polyprenyl-6-methoxyphenol hydroxylase-like FAD-dependent oxidoreductase